MITRPELITQLRIALGILEAPGNEIAEFEIGDTEFCFEFEKEKPKGVLCYSFFYCPECDDEYQYPDDTTECILCNCKLDPL